MTSDTKTEESCFKQLNRFFDNHKAIIEFIGLIVALFVLWIYYEGNQLTRRSLDLNKHQFMSSYVPWLSIQDVGFNPINRTIDCQIMNHSDVPAFIDDSHVLFIPKNGGHNFNIKISPQMPDFVPPKQILRISHPIYPDTTYQAIYDDFFSQKLSLKFTVVYRDVFNRSFSVTEIVDSNPDKTKMLTISSARITGTGNLSPILDLSDDSKDKITATGWSWLFSPRDYWYAFISAIMGCIGGITWANCQFKKSQNRKNAQSRDALIDVLGKMIELADDSAKQFKANGQPSFPIEHQRASALVGRISKFKDGNLRADLEGLIYQCSHFNGKLTVVNSAYLTSRIHNSGTAILVPYNVMMMNHAEQIVEWAKASLEKLKKESF